MIKFDRTKPYNDLPLLPPPENIIDKEVLLQWGYASRNLAELNKNLLRLTNPFMLINTITLQEAKSSSEIENIFTTGDELYKAVADTVKEENAPANIKEVLHYREALWTGYNLIREEAKMTMEIMISVFQKIKNTAQNIRPPQSKVVIRRGDSVFQPGEIIYTPPHGKKIIESYLDNLITFLSEDEIFSMDPLLKMAIAHYQFEAIHPFTDGNGRAGRIINLLYLVNKNLLSYPVLYLSKYIIETKDDYYFRLGSVTQRGDWKKWLIYMMKAVEQTAALTNHLIDEIISQMESTLKYGQENLKWYTKDVNEALFKQPYIKPAILGNLMKRTSRTTLTKYMQELTKLGILSPRLDGKEVFYLNNDLIRILEG